MVDERNCFGFFVRVINQTRTSSDASLHSRFLMGNIVCADVELHHMKRDVYLLSLSGSFPPDVATLRHSSHTKFGG